MRELAMWVGLMCCVAITGLYIGWGIVQIVKHNEKAGVECPVEGEGKK
jgi:hypothetical protein